MHPSLLVIIPCYNEEQNIRAVVADLQSSIGGQADILVVDDCSTDATIEILNTLDVVTIALPFNLGYSGALQTGYKYALSHNYDYIVQFDADGQHLASEIANLLDAGNACRADIIIGSRFADSGTNHQSALKRFATAIFCAQIKTITGVTIHDPTSGFQLLNRRTVERYSKMHNFPYYPDANVIIEMILNGYVVKEVQVAMQDRLYGESMHSGLLRQGKYMVKLFYSIFIIILKYLPSKFNSKAR